MTPSIPTIYILETVNPMLPKISLVLLIYQNKVQCSMCELPTVHTCDLSLSYHSGNKQFVAMFKIIC